MAVKDPEEPGRYERDRPERPARTAKEEHNQLTMVSNFALFMVWFTGFTLIGMGVGMRGEEGNGTAVIIFCGLGFITMLWAWFRREEIRHWVIKNWHFGYQGETIDDALRQILGRDKHDPI